MNVGNNVSFQQVTRANDCFEWQVSTSYHKQPSATHRLMSLVVQTLLVRVQVVYTTFELSGGSSELKSNNAVVNLFS